MRHHDEIHLHRLVPHTYTRPRTYARTHSAGIRDHRQSTPLRIVAAPAKLTSWYSTVPLTTHSLAHPPILPTQTETYLYICREQPYAPNNLLAKRVTPPRYRCRTTRLTAGTTSRLAHSAVHSTCTQVAAAQHFAQTSGVRPQQTDDQDHAEHAAEASAEPRCKRCKRRRDE